MPTDAGRNRGEEIKRLIEHRWSPPANYFHLLDGGHVAAARRHKDAACVASLDLRRFFDQVTRSKVHRALKSIGFPHADAWEMACDSTVDKRPPKRAFSIPFGFVQSPIVASLVLVRSGLGTAIREMDRRTIMVSVYVDDLIISGPDQQSVGYVVTKLNSAANESGFEFNADKMRPPAPTTTSFNIEFGSGTMRIIDDRMTEFELAVRQANEFRLAGILGYVHSVNAQQHDELEQQVTS